MKERIVYLGAVAAFCCLSAWGAQPQPNVSFCNTRDQDIFPLQLQTDALLDAQPQTSSKIFEERMKRYFKAKKAQAARDKKTTHDRPSELYFPHYDENKSAYLVHPSPDRLDKLHAISAVWGQEDTYSDDDTEHNDSSSIRPSSSFGDMIKGRAYGRLAALSGRAFSGRASSLALLPVEERKAFLQNEINDFERELTTIINYWIQKHEPNVAIDLRTQFESERLMELLNHLVEAELLSACINDYLETFGPEFSSST